MCGAVVVAAEAAVEAGIALPAGSTVFDRMAPARVIGQIAVLVADPRTMERSLVVAHQPA
jgi:hypothetical protein